MLMIAINKQILIVLFIAVFFLGLLALIVLIHITAFIHFSLLKSKPTVFVAEEGEEGVAFAVLLEKPPVTLLNLFLSYTLNISFTFEQYKTQFELIFNDHPQNFLVLKNRGAYQYSYTLATNDFFGFLTLPLLKTMGTQPLAIAPVKPKTEPNFAISTLFIDQKQRLLNSIETLNNRPYFPGDDSRLINWKVFGHFNELFVRTHKQSNYQENIVQIVFVTPPQTTPITLNHDKLDQLIYKLLILTDLFVANNYQVNLSIGEKLYLHFNSNLLEHRLLLADIITNDDLSQPLLNFPRYENFYLFMGLADDNNFLSLLGQVKRLKPLVFTLKNQPIQSIAQFNAELKTLKLEAIFV